MSFKKCRIVFSLFLACGMLHYTPAYSTSSFLLDAIRADGFDTTVPATLNLAKAKKIEFVSIRKETGKSGSDPGEYKKKCASWILTRSQLEKITRKFKQVSSESQYLAYQVIGCEMTGKIKIDNTAFEYRLNAGSTLTLWRNDSSWHYVYTYKDWPAFFITGEDKPEKY